MLRRALRVAPADAADGTDPETWSAAAPVDADFWSEAGPRPRRWRLPRPPFTWPVRTGRARMVAASALVAALAVGWIATLRMGGAPRTSPAARAPSGVASRPAATVRSAGAPASAPTADPGRLLRASVPVGALCAYGPRSASEAHCSIGGVEVEYRLVGRDALASGYFSAIGVPADPKSPVPAVRSGPPRCARGARTSGRGRVHKHPVAGSGATRAGSSRVEPRCGGRSTTAGCSRTRRSPAPTSRRSSRGGIRTRSVDRPGKPSTPRQTLVRSDPLAQRNRECPWRSSARPDSVGRS